MMTITIGCGDSTLSSPNAIGDGNEPPVADLGYEISVNSPDAPSADSVLVCMDHDEDGFGEHCSAGLDCNDNNPAIHPKAEEVCNGVDDDCDLDIDEGCRCIPKATQSCGATVGACTAGEQLCLADGTWGACTNANGPSSETCNGVDDDCNGSTDDGLTPPACALTEGVCSGRTAICAGTEGWLPCDYGQDYQTTESTCDGEDNDCDGLRDEDLEPPACALTRGVCAGAKQTCGSGGWLPCDSNSYGPDYLQTELNQCDGKDNDCDGVTDEGCVSCTASTAALAPYAGGVGSIEDPFVICSVAQFLEIGNRPPDWDKHFALGADLDLATVGATQYKVIGDPSSGTRFTGSFDGLSHSISNFSCTSSAYAVGLFGHVDGNIMDLTLINPTVISLDPAANSVGALVGQIYEGNLTNCSVRGGSVQGTRSVGGLIGISSAKIEACDSSATVSGDRRVGGLVGEQHRTSIKNSHATGKVTAASSDAGGILGSCLAGDVWDSYATGDVIGSVNVGGLVGGSSGGCRVYRSHATGRVQGEKVVGGLFGLAITSPMIDCYATGAVSGKQKVGGLAGESWSSDILRSYATGAVSGDEHIGGLVGYLNGFDQTFIFQSWAKGNVTGTTNVGGLVGWSSLASISASYALNHVTAKGSAVGGLVGLAEGSWIEHAYAQGTVSAGSNVGGLVGILRLVTNKDDINKEFPIPSVIDFSWAASSVPNVNASGGLVGLNDKSEVYRSFWDTSASGQATMCGNVAATCDDARGLTTAPMKTQSTFNGAQWDFIGPGDGGNDLWFIAAGSYPSLWFQHAETTTAPFSGEGTQQSPYLITSVTDLNSIGYNPRYMNAVFNMTADIDFKGGGPAQIIGRRGIPFAGIFDGKNHMIRNMVIQRPDESHVGLFAFMELISGLSDFGVKLANLGVSNAKVQGNSYVGGLVGRKGQVSIDRCFFKGEVQALDNFAGGLVGYSRSGQISNSYTRGKVTADDFVAGIAGVEWRGFMTSCITTAEVSSQTGPHSGGITSFALSAATWNDIFWDMSTTGQSTSAKGVGKTTAEMKDVNTYSSKFGFEEVWGWDGFAKIWKLDAVVNDGYPYLAWE
ncbi:MAG: putative metal-binding motif-containing protein [Deltaproteobacteria bacterium]|nr:putative metal-binding motif-containing protein [Deltaproteobacteria bacterium]